MDILELIESNMDVERILEHYEFQDVHSKGHYTRACCLLHGGNNNQAFVMREDGVWSCHTSDCGSGSVFQLVQKIEKCSFKHALQKVADILGLDTSNVNMNVSEEDYIKELKRYMKTMKRISRKAEAVEITMPQGIRQISKYRSFEESTLDYFQLGYVEEVDFTTSEKIVKLKKRLILPIYQHGKLVGYALRRTNNADIMKWANQPYNIKSGNMLYNLDNVIGCESFVICEGFFDAWAYHEIGIKAVSTFGAQLTDEQVKIILRTGCTSITLSYDNDDAGRKATQTAIEKLRGKVDVYEIGRTHGKDPEGTVRHELSDSYKNRRRIC